VYKQKLCIEAKSLNMQLWKSKGNVAEYMRQSALFLLEKKTKNEVDQVAFECG
jgi:hypothetical protein